METEYLPEASGLRRRMPASRELWSPGKTDRAEQAALRKALASGECDHMTDAEWEQYFCRRSRRGQQR